jgi:hypothetical protein
MRTVIEDERNMDVLLVGKVDQFSSPTQFNFRLIRSMMARTEADISSTQLKRPLGDQYYCSVLLPSVNIVQYVYP